MQAWRALLASGSIVWMGATGGSPRPCGSTNDDGILRIGESKTVCIRARPHWNHTCIRVACGARYQVRAKGTWWDKNYEHGPAGDPSPNDFMRRWEGWRRMPHADWFALICALDSRKRTAFPVFPSPHGYPLVAELVAPATGELTCFANDVWLFYFNNTGTIQMTVTGLGKTAGGEPGRHE